MVRKPLANGLQTKSVYVWTGLQTCTVPSTNGLHTVRRERKFVSLCANTKRTGCAECPFHAPGVLCSPQVRGKLINRAPLMRRMRTAQCVCGTVRMRRSAYAAQCVCGALVYTKLNTYRKIVQIFFQNFEKLPNILGNFLQIF